MSNRNKRKAAKNIKIIIKENLTLRNKARISYMHNKKKNENKNKTNSIKKKKIKIFF